MFVGVFLMCCSVGWFCVFSTLIQFFDLYPSDVILVRASIQAAILGAILVWQGHPLTVTKESVRLAFLASFANLLFPTVIHLLPLGTGTILSHSAVGFTAFFAWILLKEPVSGMKGVCIVAIFLGQLMVVQPPFLFDRYVPSQILGIDQYLGICMGVLSGAAFGLLLVLGSMTGVPTEHYVLIASFPGIFFGFLVGLKSSKSQIFSVGVEELMIVLPKVTACGVFGVLGFVFLVASMGKCPSVLQSLLSSTESNNCSCRSDNCHHD
ncbi:solute carrier family 35 member G1-like isoform X2 [Tigriopus californicus]|uniref:solute carrier family 35 member G1-like isoform X2 n=1 Tax=Tigriopus californicus TaxID=6832 RepID=UPI0027D9F912|nr:solute carrier family 35 member G1-like isoform X2 [Tigriopus californicus]